MESMESAPLHPAIQPGHGVKSRSILPQLRYAASWQEYERKSAEFWELYLDLIMVACCKGVSDALTEDLTLDGMLTFLVVFGVMLTAWLQYTIWHARFSDNSLVGSLFSYLFFVGTAGVGLASAPNDVFFFAAWLQRAALLLMYSTSYTYLASGRRQLRPKMALLACSWAIILIGMFFFPLAPRFTLALVILVEVPFDHTLVFYHASLLREDGTPLNIDHFSERMGCMVMVVLGESVLSAVINTTDATLDLRLYLHIAVSLVATFAIAAFYFALEPVRHNHALRRSIGCGLAYVEAHIVLFAALLLMGVGVKFVTAALVADASLAKAHARLLFYSLSVAMTALLAIRLLHFWGKEPKPTDAPNVKRTKYFWWCAMALSPTLPLAGLRALRSSSDIRPIVAVLVLSASIFTYTFIESLIMSVLTQHRTDVVVRRLAISSGPTCDSN